MFDRSVLSLEGMRPVLVSVVLLALLVSGLVVGQALSLAQAIVNVWGGEDVWGQLPLVAAFACCFALRQVVRALSERRLDEYAHGALSVLRGRLVEALYENGSSIVARWGSGAVADELVAGVEKAERYVSLVVPKTVELVVIPCVLAVAIIVQDPISGVIVVVCYPFIIVFMRLIGYTASDESAKRHAGFVAMSNHFLDALRGMGTLRAFGVARRYGESVYAASERYRELVMKTLRIATLSSAVLDVFATCGLAAVAIMLGFRLVEGSIAFFPALVVLMLVPEYFLPVKAYASDYHAALDGKSALHAIVDMASAPRRSVEVALEGGGVEVSCGERVAIVGRSGAGKTTLLDVVAGLVDADASCVPIRVCCVGPSGFSDREWQRRIAYIPQHPHIFSGTLRDNVAFYAPDACDEAVHDALARVGLARLVGELPEGIETPIGRGGRALSGGEAQRVALARALVDEGRSVWLLDEPGSNLDIQTELELKESMVPLMEGKTVLIATHRSHWLNDVDRVIDVGGLAEGASVGADGASARRLGVRGARAEACDA